MYHCRQFLLFAIDVCIYPRIHIAIGMPIMVTFINNFYVACMQVARDFCCPETAYDMHLQREECADAVKQMMKDAKEKDSYLNVEVDGIDSVVDEFHFYHTCFTILRDASRRLFPQNMTTSGMGMESDVTSDASDTSGTSKTKSSSSETESGVDNRSSSS
jgi:hypothetical protein